ncbi:MAG: IclR family transcriptional regulator [Candidatus Dormibacterales bacterium]
MLESADRVLRVLETFTPHERDLSLTDIARRLDLPKSSVHRLLATLIEHGLVERDQLSRRYRLGIKLFEIGSTAIQERGLHSAAYPILEGLTLLTGETTHLAVLSGIEAVYVYKIDSPSSIMMPSRVGGRAPCHCTSIGKVLLAWNTQDLYSQVVWSGLRPYTRNTLTTVEALEAELVKVRAQGYALDLEEFEEGLHCLAAPVRDHGGRVIAAVGVAGPSRRLTEDQLRRLVPQVTDSALELSRNLGYVPSARLLPAAAGS